MNIFSNIGITELIVILLLALLVVGPERLPELSRKLAKGLRDVRQAYENITKDLGPELMSLQETTREIRDSVDSVRSIPKDVVGSVIRAAELEDTVQELKGVEQSLQQASKSVAQAGAMVRKPLDEVVETAQGALKPAAAAATPPKPAGVGPEAEPVAPEPEAGPGDEGEAAPAQAEETPTDAPDAGGEEQADG